MNRQELIPTSPLEHHDAPSPALIDARTDQQAVQAFLDQQTTSGSARFAPTTRSNYEKEFRRLLWYTASLNKSFSQLNLEDARGFVAMLNHPPLSMVGLSKRPYGAPDWKPFVVKKNWAEGDPVLSPASIHLSITTIKGLFNWLQSVGYVSLNPFVMMKTSHQERRLDDFKRKSRALLIQDIRHIFQTLAQDEQRHQGNEQGTRKVQREKWLFHAYLYSGLRLSELIRNNTSSLQSMTIANKALWKMNVIGKGGKPAELPVPKPFMEALYQYRVSLGKPPAPSPLVPEPFFFSLSGKKPLTSRASLHDIFKGMMERVALTLETQGKLTDAARIRASSVHWLRHSFVTIGVELTNDVAAMSELARHSDIKTTMGYNHQQLSRLADTVESISRHIEDSV
ncbi:tyrosine-type recombinase/integrase [Endozoicomonas lisbonensis]|uniref:Site-specific recombinase XerD n=1 Tax=Endozoicomonas lisbonensis TaxID=3120522 RepID=A0ABV2SCF6_9GAMM